MASTPTQTYANHVHQPRAWGIFWLIGMAALLLALWIVIRDRTLVSLDLLLLSIGLVGATTVMRLFALRHQDRIIRLEMDARLRRLGLDRFLGQLALRQLVALRFASDAELPSLAARAVTENLTGDQIKRAVTDWQADWMRT
jgi:hypothetical protein